MKMTPEPAAAGYKEIPCPEIGEPAVERKAYEKGPCRIIVSRDYYDGPVRWHLSISCADRLPTWEELRDARYALVPDDATMVMILPPKKEYVNIHDYCFHLHEIIE